VGTVPLLVLALAITVFTNWLLHASAFMMVVAVGTILLYTLAASALALSFGALYPQFGTENAAQIPTSFGGLVYMMSSLSLLAAIIMVEAGPVTDRLRIERFSSSSAGSTAELVVAGAIVVATCAAATIIPLRMALHTVERMEW
jgi:ABC-2 type transport system permease protein